MENAIAKLSEIGFFFDQIILILGSNREIRYLNDTAHLYFGNDSNLFQKNFDNYCSKYGLLISCETENYQHKIERRSRQKQITSRDSNNEIVIIDWKIFNVHVDLTDDSSSILLTGKDISSEFNFHDKIDQLEIQLNGIIELMAGNYWWKDTRGIYKGFNQSLLQLLGVQQQDVIGKTDYDLPWAETADLLVQNDRLVLMTGKPYKTEEEIKSASGQIRIFEILKIPLMNKKGEVIGVMGNSIDLTDHRNEIEIATKKIKADEALRLKMGFEHQKLLLEEQEKFIMLANKVAHDINSPLASLNMMMSMCTELPEEKRSIMKTATSSILDIANNLLAAYRNQEHQTTTADEARQPLLVSDLLVQLISEKKVQYLKRSVKFEADIEVGAQFAFTLMQPSQFRRAISNLINNAVDALDTKSDGVITIQLNSDAEFVEVNIQDNGKGMRSDMVEKIVSRKNFTEGKTQGHGIGMQQVWDTIDNNEGKMTVDSIPGKGTTIQLTFPRVDSADWLAHEIQLEHNSIILILDDDESIHGAWDARFKPLLERYSTLRAHHFMQGSELLGFVGDLHPDDKERVIFLSDFELLGQSKNGLEIIEICSIKNTALITSYYTDLKIRDKARQLGTKILPKKMASIVPIRFHAPN